MKESFMRKWRDFRYFERWWKGFMCLGERKGLELDVALRHMGEGVAEQGVFGRGSAECLSFSLAYSILQEWFSMGSKLVDIY